MCNPRFHRNMLHAWIFHRLTAAGGQRYMEPTRGRRQDSVRAKSYAVQGVSRLSHAISLPAMAVSVTPTYRSAHFLTSRTLRGLKTTAPPDYSAARPNSYRDEIRGLQIAESQPNSVNRKGFRYVQRRAVTELALIPAARQWAVISARIRKIGCVKLPTSKHKLRKADMSKFARRFAVAAWRSGRRPC